MTARNPRIRFLQNNEGAADGVTPTASGSMSTFGIANAFNPFRFKRWKPPGTFIVTSSRNLIYINDGSNKTITLTAGTYTYTSLASHIQTKLNASSSVWTCTYATTGVNAFKFRIGRSAGTSTLRLTQTTNAAWDMLGFVGVADFSAGTGTNGDQIRNHTSEFVNFDLLAAREIKALIMLGPGGELFSIPDTATVTLKASNTNTSVLPWGSTYDLAWTLTAEDDGIFKMLDDEAGTDTTYRYWQVEWIDRTNTAGPEAYDICQIYLGDYVTPTSRDVNDGITRTLVDPSVVSESENGTLYFRRRTKAWNYSGLSFEQLDQADRLELERVFSELGKTTPFFVALDPLAQASDRVGYFTKYVVFAEDPQISHVRFNLHSLSMNLREVI